jgi:predicted DCC family thiol-disulfide oxidoreductase YuxK
VARIYWAGGRVLFNGDETDMSEFDKNAGVSFVYDGECPLCDYAAQALRIKKDYGALNLVNAREQADDPLVLEITRRGYDLDEGMVIYADDRFYHGKDALKFMAQCGETQNIFMAFCKSLFWSNTLSSLSYPWLRGMRNWLLRRRSVGRIDNLNLKSEPIFKSIFGDKWDQLPPVLRKHYANHPYSNDQVVVKGTLDVMCAGPIRIFAPLMKLMGQIPARNEKKVSVSVEFQSDPNSKAFHFIRSFNFKNEKPYIFHSRMMQIKGNEVIEIMPFRLGWKMLYHWDGEKVVLAHNGYALCVFGHFIPVPLTLLMGKGYAEEIAIDDDRFDMVTHITHPWWGKIYEYKGRFKVVKKESTLK